MNIVYILTKYGAAYTNEGLEYVYNSLAENPCYDRNDHTVYIQGAKLNDIDYFINSVKKDNASGHKVYAVFSGRKGQGMDFYELNEHNLSLLMILKDLDTPSYKPATTWELFEAIMLCRRDNTSNNESPERRRSI